LDFWFEIMPSGNPGLGNQESCAQNNLFSLAPDFFSAREQQKTFFASFMTLIQCQYHATATRVARRRWKAKQKHPDQCDQIGRHL
jgi:hypothetical protein